MGANGSSEHKPRRRESPNKHKGQDIVRRAQVQYNTPEVANHGVESSENVFRQSAFTRQDFENKDSTQSHDSSSYPVHQNLGDVDIPKNFSPELPPPFVNTHAVQQNVKLSSAVHSVSRLPQHAVDKTSLNLNRWEDDFSHISQPRPSQSPHREEVTPYSPNNNLSTIKKAKVNVHDKINLFKSENPAPSGIRRLSAHVEESNVNGTPILTHLPPKLHVKRNTHIPDQDTNSSPEEFHRLRRFSDFRERERTQSDLMLAEIDAQENRSGSAGSRDKPKISRMNTIDAFNQLKEDHAVLNKFEKAKPAARRPRTKPNVNRASPLESEVDDLKVDQVRRLPRNGVTSMYALEGQYGSDSNLVTENRRKRDDIEIEGNLMGIHKETGKKYAMDDTAYETLSRRKKLPGQRHALAVTDREIEKNFLLSLKRNFQFKLKALDDKGTQQTDPEL